MKNSLSTTRGLLAGTSILVLSSLSMQASAAPLFDNQGTARAANAAHISSSRDVTINRRAMQQSQLEFSLDGVPVTAVRDRIERHKAGQTVWVGHVSGSPSDTVIVTATRNTFSGVIHNKGATYEISGNGRGVQTLDRVDTSRLPLEDIGGIPDGGGATGGSLPQQNEQALGDVTQQDLLVVYTQGACTAAGGAADVDCNQIQADIATATADLNAAYTASGIDIFMNVTSMRFINYADAGVSTGTALGQIRSTSDGIMDEVHGWRNEDGADMVALIMDGTGCGTAYSPASATSAFNVTDESCMVGNRTMAHEIGHNQGALHDRDQHGQGTVGAYNYGFKRCSDGSDEDFGSPYFRTVMSYSCSGAPRVGRFSNPNVTYLGVPQGIDHTIEPARGAWNARTLNESATYVAGFRAAVAVTPPDAPSGLGASANGFDAIDVSWADNSDNETSFDLERSLDGSSWSGIATLGANTTNFADSGLSAETQYFYRVRATNGAGSSVYSNTSSATTDAAPSTIDDVALSSSTSTGSVSGTYTSTHTDNGSAQTITEASSGGPKRRRQQSYVHTWTFDVTGGVGGVTLAANAWVSGSEGANFDYSTDNGNSWNSMFAVTGNATSTTNGFAFPGGVSGAMLIRATDAAQTNGEGVDSLSVDSLIITSNTIPGTPPDNPTGLSVSGTTSSSVDLSFTDNADNEFGFEIWRSGSAHATCTAGSVVETTGANSGTGIVNATDSSAAPSTTYWYYAKAFNGAGDNGSCTNVVSATTGSAPAISASGNGFKDKGRQNVDISWSGANGSNVDINRDGVTVATPTNNGAYTDPIGVKGGGSYTYEVCETGSTTACSPTFNIVF